MSALASQTASTSLGLTPSATNTSAYVLAWDSVTPRVREDLLNLGTLDAHAVNFGVAPQVLFGCEVGAGGRERAVGEGRMSVGTHSAPEAHQRPSDASL